MLSPELRPMCALASVAAGPAAAATPSMPPAISLDLLTIIPGEVRKQQAAEAAAKAEMKYSPDHKTSSSDEEEYVRRPRAMSLCDFESYDTTAMSAAKSLALLLAAPMVKKSAPLTHSR